MDVEVVDPSGGGLGLAIGLVELGHRVVHRGPTSWAAAGDAWPARCSRELAQRFFGRVSAGAGNGNGGAAGGAAARRGDPDLVVLVDVFADYLWALERGLGVRPGAVVRDPLQDDAGTLVYPDRLAWFCRRAASARAVAVVDLSDAAAPREPAFATFPHATLLARECPPAGDGPWRPFPFLYNHVMLWLELVRPRGEWWLAPRQRVRSADWAFCGTLDHLRYAGRRRAQLAELGQRWPHLRGRVETSVPFAEVVRIWQQVGCGVDLPGAGELCFRLHECLALGTPVVRPFAARIALAPGLADVVASDPERLPVASPDDVHARYAAHYAPRAAAGALLAACARQDANGNTGVPGGARSVCQTTIDASHGAQCNRATGGSRSERS